MIELDGCVFSPELRADVVTCNDLVRMFEKRDQYLQGLLLEPDCASLENQFSGTDIEPERIEARHTCRWKWSGQGCSP